MALSCSKKLSALLRRITSKHHSDFYSLVCLHAFATQIKRQSHKEVCKKKDFCNAVMPSKDTKRSEFNQYQIFDKAAFLIYADLECLIENIDGCKNNPENSYTTKVGEHTRSGFSVSTISSSKSIENKYDVYRGKDCMKKFCESLREHATMIMSFKKKKNEVLNKRAEE